MSLPIRIRAAQIADADAAIAVVRRSIKKLCALDHEGDPATLLIWCANKTEDDMRKWIVAHTVFVAVKDECIAGVAATRGNGEVLLNYVAPEARFKGVSKSLMQGVEAWASSCGVRWLTLESTATARRFYLSSGWTMAGPPLPGFGITMRYPMRKPVKSFNTF